MAVDAVVVSAMSVVPASVVVVGSDGVTEVLMLSLMDGAQEG